MQAQPIAAATVTTQEWTSTFPQGNHTLRNACTMPLSLQSPHVAMIFHSLLLIVFDQRKSDFIDMQASKSAFPREPFVQE